jgi:hypothetical protein
MINMRGFGLHMGNRWFLRSEKKVAGPILK